MARKDNPGWGAAVVGALETFAAYLRADGMAAAPTDSDVGTETGSRMSMFIQMNYGADGDAVRERLERLPSRWERPQTDAAPTMQRMFMSLELDEQLAVACQFEGAMRIEIMRVVLAAALMQAMPRGAVICANPAITRLDGRAAIYMDAATPARSSLARSPFDSPLGSPSAVSAGLL